MRGKIMVMVRIPTFVLGYTKELPCYLRYCVISDRRIRMCHESGAIKKESGLNHDES